MVWRTVSRIQPSMTFRVPQLPSPLRSFFKDTASFRFKADTLGMARTLSMECNRCRRRAFSRRRPPCPSCMKSSTKTSVVPSGRRRAQFDGGAISSFWASEVCLGSRPANCRSACASSIGFGLGLRPLSTSSWAWAGLSSQCSGTSRGDFRKEALASSQMVSDMVLNVGGDSVQPMVQDIGMAMSCGSSS